MRVSLVTGSLLRQTQLSRMIRSLESQRHQDVELIVVEQSSVLGAIAVMKTYPSVDSTVLESECGLSRARNIGLARVTGDIVGFPDDDCWYQPGTLARVVHRFMADPELGLLCARVMTSEGPMLRYPSGETTVDRSNVWRTAVSPGIFVRRSLAERIGLFDEHLGVGAGTNAGSGEETDYVLRALASGALAVYDPLIHVSHPSPHDVKDRLEPSLGYSYGYGFGAVMRRHGYGRGAALSAIARPFVGAVLARGRGDRVLGSFRLAVSRGRLAGYRRGAVR